MTGAVMFTFILVECLSDAAISAVYVSDSTATGGVDGGIARARAVDVRGGLAGAGAIDVADATTATGVLELNVRHGRSAGKGIPALTRVFSWAATYSLMTSCSTGSTAGVFAGSREGERRFPAPPRPVEKI